MQPSSLIFLVIIAVWATFFVKFWVLRREHLATAHAVDQFSESMRVLERRSQVPAADRATPARSYAVSPTRALRHHQAAPVESPAAAPSPTAAPIAAPAPRATATPRLRPSRRVRGLAVLVSLLGILVAGPLVALSVVPWWGVLVPVATAALSVAWVRSAVAATRAARRSQAPARQATERHATERTAAAVEEQPVLPTPEPARVFDVQATEVAVAAALAPAAVTSSPERMRPLVDEDDIPLTWDPVPVPRPTYTMKARVSRPAPVAADLVGDSDTEYTAYDEAPQRRAAGA